ncbi:MAG TPA: MerR family transcriptional regulator [Cytophagales bacterium]|nr:MerR family transcriptional regulator [Cytophagales bacterium]
MPYKENLIEKKYYTIGEVADIFGVAPSLIRFWESEFDIINPRKNSKGNRQFTKPDISNIRIVYQLVKEKGYTLQGAKEAIKNNTYKTSETLDVVDSLKKLRGFLQEIKNQLP